MLEASALRARLEMMLDAFERAEPSSPSQPQLRAIVDKARSVTTLKAIAREFRGMTEALPGDARRALDRDLFERFGPDPEAARDAEIVAKVLARGRIRSEREYRAVETHSACLPRDPSDTAAEAEYLRLTALLDAFMAGA